MAEHRFYRGDKNEREVTSDGAGTFGPRLTAKYERRFHVGVAKLCSAFLGLTLLAAAYAEKHRSDYRPGADRVLHARRSRRARRTGRLG